MAHSRNISEPLKAPLVLSNSVYESPYGLEVADIPKLSGRLWRPTDTKKLISGPVKPIKPSQFTSKPKRHILHL